MTCTVYIATSLDGYIAGPDDDIEWLELVPNPDNSDLGFFAFIENIDALIMGRSTYETVMGFGMGWHYPVPGIVLSTTLTELPETADEPTTQPVTLFNGSPGEALAHAKQMGFEHLYVDGGKTIQGFLQDDLIDELIIAEIPVLLGAGAPLFGSLPEMLEFELLGSEVLLDQIVKKHYRRKR